MSQWNPYQPSEDALPPKDIRILNIKAEAWPDQSRRVRIHLEITPFQERPNIEVTITDPDGYPLSRIHIIETIESLITFTMHLRDVPNNVPLSIQARLYYADSNTVDEIKIPYEIT